jgi:hypothetical protein
VAGWTAADEARLREVVGAGTSAQRASVALKRRVYAVKQRAKELGILFPLEAALKKARKKLLTDTPDKYRR